MSKFIAWIKKVFGVIGEIWETLQNSSAGSVVIKALTNTELQKKAMEIVAALQDSELTGIQKEQAFNDAFNVFCDTNGYTVAKSTVNCIRELALAAFKAKTLTSN